MPPLPHDCDLATDWSDEAATAACAQSIAKVQALRTAVVALHGDLGAGKTSFVRHLLRALGVTGRIRSPTYALVEAYEAPVGAGGVAPGLPIWHFDFYRFTDPREWEDAGLRDLFAQPGLKLCEWPERARGVMPLPDLELHIEVLPPASARAHDEAIDPDVQAPRRVRWHALTPLGQVLVESVRGLTGLAALAPSR